jgi:hypothetical protein
MRGLIRHLRIFRIEMSYASRDLNIFDILIWVKLLALSAQVILSLDQEMMYQFSPAFFTLAAV